MAVLRFMRFVLIIIAFLVTFFPIYINVSAFALTEEELLQETQRLEQAMDAAVEDPGNPKLLYEKAKVMLETLGPMFSLRTATNSLLSAIEIDPDNKEYKNYLCEVYGLVLSRDMRNFLNTFADLTLHFDIVRA